MKSSSNGLPQMKPQDLVVLDEQLYEMLVLFEAIRVGRAREKNLTLEYLKERLL